MDRPYHPGEEVLRNQPNHSFLGEEPSVTRRPPLQESLQHAADRVVRALSEPFGYDGSDEINLTNSKIRHLHYERFNCSRHLLVFRVLDIEKVNVEVLNSILAI